jgi:hypothetical protein
MGTSNLHRRPLAYHLFKHDSLIGVVSQSLSTTKVQSLAVTVTEAVPKDLGNGH